MPPPTAWSQGHGRSQWWGNRLLRLKGSPPRRARGRTANSDTVRRMTFKKDARLDPGQVNDQRGSSGGGGGGFPGGFQIPTGGRGGGGMGIPAGGGIGSIIVLVIIIGVIFFLRGGLGG